LGQLYLEREQWADACAALNKAFEKGDLHDEPTTHLLAAICSYQQKQYQSAIRHLRIARESETETTRNSANQWMMLVERDAQALVDEQGEAIEPSERADQIEGEMPDEGAPQTGAAPPAGEAAPPEPAAVQPAAQPQVEKVSQSPQSP